MDFPFEQKIQGNKIIRFFDPNVDTEELVWHRDLKDRKVKIIESGNWKFQEEDELPVDLYPNQVIWIQKSSWHRVIRGDNKLVIEIEEFD